MIIQCNPHFQQIFSVDNFVDKCLLIGFGVLGDIFLQQFYLSTKQKNP